MTFLNFALLGGAAALAVPLAIHLLSKSRFRQVDWAAMFLLEQVMKQNRKRVRIEQLIMLLIRCAIPVLLALAMAQPVLNGWNALVGDAKGSSVVLLDASYSMQADDNDTPGASRYDRARRETAAILGAMPKGSEASVVRIGGGEHPLVETPTSETDRLVRRLDETDAGLGIADSAASLRRGVESLGEAGTVKRDLILISDFQRVNWSPAPGSGSSGDAGGSAPAAAVGGLERQRLRELLDGLEVKPSITLIPVGGDAGRNVAVTAVTLSNNTIGVGQRVRIKATLLNTGEVDAPDTPVRLIVDGAEIETQRVTVNRGESAEVLFFHRFESGGGHTLDIATRDDALRADDVFRTAVEVLEDLPVLLVSGDTGKPFPENETDFLELALQPFAAVPDAPLADLVRVETIEPGALNTEQVQGRRVVVLANVERLSDPQVLALRLFVQAGGGLILFPGDKTDAAWMNDKLADLLPATIDGLSGEGLDFQQPAGLLDQRHDHPALTLWNDPANGALADGAVRAWYQLSLRAEGETFARLSTGHPLLTERHVGDGTVILAATAADADWSNLPARAFYLPLVQRLVTYAATRNAAPRNVELGRPMVADLPGKPDNGRAQWLTPDGTRVDRPIEQRGGRFVCELPDTVQPGYYRLMTPGNAPMLFASNAPRDESKLDALSKDELEALAEALGADLVEDAEQYAALDATRRHGTPVWRMVWVGLLALLFGELLLQQWFGKGGGR